MDINQSRLSVHNTDMTAIGTWRYRDLSTYTIAARNRRGQRKAAQLLACELTGSPKM